MKKHKVSIREYSSSKLTGLSDATRNALFDVADHLSTQYRSNVLKCSLNRHGDVVLLTTSFVGVIDIDESLSIEITPKIYDGRDDTAVNLRNLFYMLSYSGQFTFPDKRMSSLEAYSGSFFETLIGMFAEELLDKIQNSAHHEYISEQSNRAYLKGKLLLTEHLKVNVLSANRFYTQTDDFTANNTLNQTLKYVSQGLYKLTRDASNKKRLRKCLALFDEVDDVRVSHQTASRIHLTRLNKRFENLLMLSKLFLKNQTLVAKSGEHSSWTILIDMNVLFEEFIARALQEGLRASSYKVVMQGPQKKFVRNSEDDRDVFTMKPDISIVQGGEVVRIADTKYKVLNEDDRKYGVAQADLYQMFAYSRRYSVPDITLIYPKTSGVEPHTLELPDDTRVHIRTISLSRDLRKNIKEIEQEVVGMFTSRAVEAMS